MPSGEYQVKTGDTLGAIARRFDIGVDVLARDNGISDVNRIYVGQVLKIPEPITLQQVPVQPKTYRVVAGETLVTIAQSNKVTVAALRQANKLGETDGVTIGQVLVLPDPEPPKVESSPTAQTTPTTAVQTTPTSSTTNSTSTPTQNQGSGTLKDEDNLVLGVNECYREAILAAARRTGLPPQCLAAIIEAEAAKDRKTKIWKADSQATSSSAAGLAQFLSGTWVGEACREETALHEYARGHDLITEILDKKGKRKGWEVKDSDSKTTLLALRLKPEMSIMAAAELALYSLAAIRKSFKVPDSVTRGDLARLAYLYHHEGATGGDRILRKTDTHTKEDLERQTGKRAEEYLSAHDDDATVAYRAWLGEYIDSKINPVQFTRDPKQFPAPRPLLQIAKDLSPTSNSGSSYTEAPALADVTAGKAVMRTGMKGPAVEQLQKELVRTGYLNSEDAKKGPGSYGPLTKSAVESFQKSAKVSVAAGYQGVVDKATWDALSKAKGAPQGGTTGGGNATTPAQGPDLRQIARNVHDAMDGMGTDEAKVYTNLAKLNHDATLITKFKSTYKSMYGVEVETDIRSDFSSWFGELDTALGYLKSGDGSKTQEKPQTQTQTQTKTQASTPSLKATPDLQALLKELHVSIESFVPHENAYFAQLTKLLALKGIIKATPLLTRDTFREAVRAFQKSKKLAVTEGIPDENTTWELQVDWAKSRKLKLTPVTADIVKGYDGYNNFTLRHDAVDAYNAFRKDVLAAGGVITSAGSLRVLTAEVTTGRSSTSMHYSGLALDLSTASGMQNPKKDPYVITQDGQKWRIWCKSDSASEKKLDAVVYSKKSTSIESVKVKAFDFTAVAEKHGFARIGPRDTFPDNYLSAEWWHLQYEPGLTRYMSQFGAELLSLEKYDEATLKGHTSIWKNRQRIFKRGSNGWH